MYRGFRLKFYGRQCERSLMEDLPSVAAPLAAAVGVELKGSI
jgi:hypothetical protein